MKSTRQKHGRISSVSLVNPRKNAKGSLSYLAPRVAFLAGSIAFILYFGSHLLEHRRKGTSHFGGQTVSTLPEEQAFSDVLPDEQDIIWAGAAESDFHDKYLSEEAKKRKPGKLSSSKGGPTPPAIPLSGTLPSLEDLSLESPLRLAWESAIRDLGASADAAFASVFDGQASDIPRPAGIAGTGISNANEGKAVQAYLDCMSSEGIWVYDGQGSQLAKVGAGLPVHKQSAVFASCDKSYYKHRDRASLPYDSWDVRASLKWRWEPSTTCAALAEPSWISEQSALSKPPPSRQSLCHYLRHKNILLIGDSPTQYLIHDLLLDWTAEHTLTCYGDLYCKEHGICGGGLTEGKDIGRSWKQDVRTFDALPDPPFAKAAKLIKRAEESQALYWDNTTGTMGKRDGDHRTFGTILRYRRSDTFFLNSSPSHPRHQAAYISPDTGIREINMFAIPDSRRSDVVIVSKAPIPLPRTSNDRSSRGERLARLVTELQQGEWVGDEKAVKAIQLVELLTSEIWIPEMIESLRAMKAPPAPSDNLVIYRGAWRMQPDCANAQDSSTVGFDWSSAWQYAGDGPPPHLVQPTLAQLLYSASTLPEGANQQRPLTDLRSLVFNLQVILQNHIVRKHLAPKLGIVFLDMESATSIWRSGFVGGSAVTKVPASSGNGANGQTAFMSQPASSSGDCLRMCLPSPGLALEEFFVGSLLRLFEWGWGGPERSSTWTGKGFVPVRERARRGEAL